MAANDVAPADSIVSIVDGIAMVTREPIDRLQQIIAQSWYWIGGFCAPSDTLTNPLAWFRRRRTLRSSGLSWWSMSGSASGFRVRS